MVLSVAKAHLKRIRFASVTDWEVIHAFRRTASGQPRSRPCEICVRWYDIGGERSLFVFGAAAQKPFGTLAAAQKRKAGELLLEAYRDGR